MSEIIMRYGDLECGFFQYNNKIYFAMPHGRWIFHFPVIDGKISRGSDDSNIYPDEEIKILLFKELEDYGFYIKNGDNPFDDQFWSSK